MRIAYLIGLGLLFGSCNWQPPTSDEGIVADTLVTVDTLAAHGPPDTARLDTLHVARRDSQVADNTQLRDTSRVVKGANGIDTKGASPQAVADFAKTLIGIPYVYGSTNPKIGFDCSGFITHVFNHFGIKVPRSSIDFTNVGREVPQRDAHVGDLVLFTGTNPLERHVGHMGLIVSATPDSLSFIHSTSGKAMGVTITPLNEYYQKRFVKVIRIF